MKTEKEIRSRLAIALEDLEKLKEYFYNIPLSADKDLFYIADDMTFVEAEIKTLRWMLEE